MKTARAYPETIVIECPYCEALVEHPHNGSQVWALDEVIVNGRKIECLKCGKQSLIPVRYFKGAAIYWWHHRREEEG